MLGVTTHSHAPGPTRSGPATGRRTGVRLSERWRAVLLPAALGAAATIAHPMPATPPGSYGLPAARLYTFEEIGNVTRGCQLTFDALGRVTLVQAGEYVVLNDTSWLNLAGEERAGIQMLATVCDADGSTYYGALGSWGRVVTTADGQVCPAPLVPGEFPQWVLATNFMEILPTEKGVYFGGWNGVVFRDAATGRNTFFELPAVARLFAMGDDVFASSYDRGVRRLDATDGSLEPAGIFGANAIDHIVPLSDGRHLVSASDGRLLVYANGRFANWSGPLAKNPGRVSALTKLVDGDIAIAVTGRGLYIANEQGEIRTALTSAEYQRVTRLANNEPGVLWATAESGIAKVLYGSPVSLVGQALGLPVSFPQIVGWHDGIIVASGGRLYAPALSSPDAAPRFELLKHQPWSETWAIASNDDHLLVGNGDGIFVFNEELTFEHVVRDVAVARLVLVAPDLCFVLGQSEIAVLRHSEGMWAECAPRVPGVGYPAVAHASRRAAWMELGANRAARVSLDDGRIAVRVFDSFPWEDPRWVHVSIVGNTAVLAGPPEKIFFDEETEQPGDAPELREMIDHSPHWIGRICEDEDGLLWVSHAQGVSAVRMRDGRPVLDTDTYDVIDDRMPVIWSVKGHGIWVSSGASLYHVAKPHGAGPARELRPVLDSLRDRRTGAELLGAGRTSDALGRLDFSQNSLDFRFFSGSYASRRPPTYEVRINEQPWSSLGSNSVFTLSDLRDGSYTLGVRLRNSHGVSSPAVSFPFSIAPPWYRAWYSNTAYVLLGAALGFAVIRFSVRRAEARSAALAQVIAERTRELKTTMERLRQETETSATLAERNRLAGEIHDSLEQGFTGLALQLETTAGFSNCPPQVKAGLVTALNMVAFGRNELRHVVQDLHSARLDSGDLESALAQMVSQIIPDSRRATLQVHGQTRRLGPTTEHHLLRIAQEALTNSVKHASATHLTLALAFNDDDVHLTIEDDGRGFDADAVNDPGSNHFGLPGLRDRARKIGATLEITSQPGAGTRIAVRVPLETSTPALDSPVRG